MSEHKSPTIMKFGGTSVEDAGAFRRVAEIVGARTEQNPVVVVSAMSRMTDALLAAFEIARDGGNAEKAIESLQPLFARHQQVADELLDVKRKQIFETEFERAQSELASLFESAARRTRFVQILKDEAVSYGEQLSSFLLALVLQAQGLKAEHKDARRLIVTDNEHSVAAPLFDETNRLVQLELQPLINNKEIPVMGGFIAAARNGETTTLGRGGSDYSAAIVGAALAAREIQIWTDVTGVLTCDPRLVPEAQTVPVLSYEEASELAYFGAKVLHPKTILPAVTGKIPVRVCNSREPNQAGTLILADAEIAPNRIKSIAYKKGVTILRITSARMLGAYGFMSQVFQVFERHRTVIDIITTSEVSVSLTLDSNVALESLVNELKRLGEVEVERDQAVVCVVGEGLRATSGIAGKIFSTIAGTNVTLVSHGASSVNLTFVVKETDVWTVVKQLHREFFDEQ